MHRFYYYVDPCPKCGSRKTGRYVKQPITGSGYMLEESLKAGELIRFLSFVPEKNGFCATCGHEWHTMAKLKFWPTDKIRDEMIARGTEQEYQRLLQNGKGKPDVPVAAKGKERVRVEEDDVQIIDKRPKPVIELLYIDEELLKKMQAKN